MLYHVTLKQFIKFACNFRRKTQKHEESPHSKGENARSKLESISQSKSTTIGKRTKKIWRV